MSAQRFLVAKYAPDLHRMEPRNVGIVVWSPKGIESRFLGDNENGVYAPKGIVPPGGKHAYKEWIYFWKTLIAKRDLRSDSGKLIPRSNEHFVDVLKAKSKPAFMLVDAGEMLKPASDLRRLADELFASLVKEPVARNHAEYANQLRQACDDTLEKAGVAAKPKEVTCKIGVLEKPFKFDYVVDEGSKPSAVFHRVSLWREATVNSSAFMFEGLTRYTKNLRCAALVLPATGAESDESVTPVDVLSQFVSVIDVSDPLLAAVKVRHLLSA